MHNNGIIIPIAIIALIAAFIAPSLINSNEVSYSLTANSLVIEGRGEVLNLSYLENISPKGEVVEVVPDNSFGHDIRFKFLSSAAKKFVDVRYKGLSNAPKGYIYENVATYVVVSSSSEQHERHSKLSLKAGDQVEMKGVVMTGDNKKLKYLLPETFKVGETVE